MDISSAEEGWIENRTFDEITVGDTAHMARRITRRDIELFAIVSGDMNPSHIDEAFASGFVTHGIVAHSMLSSTIISAVLGNRLPGPGTIYLSQDVRFIYPVHAGDTIDVRVTVERKDYLRKSVIFRCVGTNQDGTEVLMGTAHVTAPAEKIRRPVMHLGEIELYQHDRLRIVLEKAQKIEPLHTAVVHPCDQVSLQGMEAAAREGIMIPVLVGPEARIKAAAEANGVNIDGFEIVDTPHSHASAITAVNLAREGRVGALMKGSLHTDELMGAVVNKTLGLRTERRMSHVFVMDVPSYKWPLMITDAALNIAPGLIDKMHICQSSIELAQDIGIATPKVAILGATESVNPNMQATLDAAALCKMSERGQIVGGILDGPLAFDNAISFEAARIKKITSPVAGQADILLVPNIESGNMLAKQLTYLAGSDAAGIVLGSKVPIMLTSRADKPAARLASAAMAVLSNAGNKARLASK